MRYLLVVEEGPASFGAYVPDFSGCIAAAETRNEALALIREAIAFHLQGLARGRRAYPDPVVHGGNRRNPIPEARMRVAMEGFFCSSGA